MGILDSLLHPPERRGTLRNPTAAELIALGSAPTASGLSVTPEMALTYSAYFACVRILAESVATLPLVLYERLQPRGKRRAVENPWYNLMHNAPNPRMTRFEWMTTVMGHLVTWGNHYSERQLNGAGRTVALWPLRPDRMTVTGSVVTGLKYEYDVGGKKEPLDENQVLHIRGLGSDGVTGYSVLKIAREPIGLGLATQEFGARWFGNGARPTVVLEHPGKISKDAQERLLTGWREKHEGLSNAHRVAILEEGMKVETIGIPPEDSQFLETRKFQRVEIAAMCRVPPYMIGEMDGAIKANVEQQNLDLVQSLTAWLVCIEQRCGLALLTQTERKTLFFEFLLDSLLRGDTATRVKTYTDLVQWGIANRDEIREKENWNPIPNGLGESYWQPLNMVALGADPEPEPAAAPAQPDEEQQRSLVVEQPHELGIAVTAGWQRSPTAERRAIERRAVASDRRRLAQTYNRSLAHTAQRVVNREINDLANARERFGKAADGLAEFRTWFRRWLEGHETVVAEYVEPALRTYANLVLIELERELAREIPNDIDAFVRDYIASRANVWVARLRRAMNNALYEDEDDPWVAVDDYLARRKDKQAGWFADEETVRMGNALARTSYQLLLIATMMWVSSGESCSYCSALDGQVISTVSQFLPAGDELKPEGEDAFVSESNIGHPPLHGGCDCMIVAA